MHVVYHQHQKWNFFFGGGNRLFSKRGFLDHATHTSYEISGFDGSMQAFNHSIKLKIHDETQISLFLITSMKDLYVAILWILGSNITAT